MTNASLRARFPALARQHNGHPVAYFDGPGGTQVPRQVVEAMTDYLYNHNANTHWNYPTSAETDEAIAASRQTIAEFLNAGADEVVFGANMTTLTFHLARALGRGWGAGDVVVVTELDHHANIAPWQALVRERGIELRTVRMIPKTGQLDLQDLQRRLDGRPRMLAIGAASNALGTITDVTRAARMAHDAGALVFVDAVHYAPHVLTDVRALDCDFLACSAYKFYGPHIGVLYGRRELLEQVDVPKLAPAPNSAPERFETGTQNHEGIVGAAAAVNFLASHGEGQTRREQLASAFECFGRQSDALFNRLWNGLVSLPGVCLYGPPRGEPRTPTIAFTVQDTSPAEVARALAAIGIFVSDGDFYASTIVEKLGLAPDGLVRAGCACYTTMSDVDRLLDGVAAIV